MTEEKEVSTRGAVKIDCPHCNKRILVRKQAYAFPVGSNKYYYLVAKKGKWIPAKLEDRKKGE